MEGWKGGALKLGGRSDFRLVSFSGVVVVEVVWEGC